ncbi:MAG: ABC transporter substrate-binding protein [Deltaproteobacteria bacterium]|nr:ABC transporter substrate-binding protein [Deltaproteobacteria bacterium]
MFRVKLLRMSFFVVVSCFMSVAVVHGQNKIRAAYSSTSGIFTPVWIASDERLYQKHQTDADLVFIGGSAVAVSALIAGEIDFIYGGADPIIAGILAGADLTLAGFISTTTPISLYVAPGYTKVEDLKGKNVAVTRLASSTAYMAKVCFSQYRLEPMKDIMLIQSGGYPESLAALQAGRMQGAMLSPPFTYRAEALGYKRIWNGAGVEYPSFVLATRKTFIRDAAERALRAFTAVAEGVHIFRTDKERAMPIMGKYTRVTDRTILESTYADN